ncbi:DUF1775 domain-containing protein [Kitasatospora sp. NBC_01539]|uniref:DUF1775 domain-containing protein n=1 Tax=Kitasatospora sp. NBC_01539 TaxID=2903577 RepID=UPI003860309C
MNRPRLLARLATVPAAVLGALALAGPASAHVEVESATARALAVDAVIAFDAEGESATAGIDKVTVALPTGIAPADVTLVEAPKGWTFTPTPDGYQVAGTALAPGKSAAYTVKVRQLPNASSVAFKSLVTYSDGQVDRWIELPKNGAAPAHPAPVLKLAAASPGATPLPAAPASPSASPPAPASSAPSGEPSPSASAGTTPSDSSDDSSGGLSGGGIATIVGVGVLAVAIVAVLVRRRRTGGRD